jgi:hypothetical protein
VSADDGFVQLAPLLVHKFSRCLVEAKQAAVFFGDRYQGGVLVRGQCASVARAMTHALGAPFLLPDLQDA